MTRDYSTQRRLLALCDIDGIDWHLIAREAQRMENLDRLEKGELTERSSTATKASRLIQDAASSLDARLAHVDDEFRQATKAGAELVTVLDEDYPVPLRLIFNLAPFLFYRGTLQIDDAFSVCVVGTRNASQEGLDQAKEISPRLVESGVTVVAGLARGIDTAAHIAALDAGGRTIAVVGTGILECYPKENLKLAEQISVRGALVSQFWPSVKPRQFNFPMRNVTMSGISQGTIVVEASSTSGAKMQARLALEHGKLVFLMRSLVTRQPWAREYLKRSGAFEIEGLGDVLPRLRTPEQVSRLTETRRHLQLNLSP